MNKTLISIATAVGLALGAGQVAAYTIDLNFPYVTYGNTNSYSMPVSAYIYDQLHDGGTGPGNPYYIASGPGQIKDGVVIYTGASGQGVGTNPDGFDNAYLTPNGSSPVYADFAGTGATQPDATGKDITNNLATTWDTNLLYLKSFLDGDTPLFLFNNNETNADQNLGIWAKLWITNNTTLYDDRYLYLSNRGLIYGYGGLENGDATMYNPGNITSPLTGYANTDYVLSGGQLEANGETFNHNLGANQVAYAADVPLLNQWLAGLFKLEDSLLDHYTLHLDVRLGCMPVIDWVSGTDKHDQPITCESVKIDNGYEQLFLAANDWKSVYVDPHIIPEPRMLVLLGTCLLAFGIASRRSSCARRIR